MMGGGEGVVAAAVVVGKRGVQREGSIAL